MNNTEPPIQCSVRKSWNKGDTYHPERHKEMEEGEKITRSAVNNSFIRGEPYIYSNTWPLDTITFLHSVKISSTSERPGDTCRALHPWIPICSTSHDDLFCKPSPKEPSWSEATMTKIILLNRRVSNSWLLLHVTNDFLSITVANVHSVPF